LLFWIRSSNAVKAQFNSFAQDIHRILRKNLSHQLPESSVEQLRINIPIKTTKFGCRGIRMSSKFKAGFIRSKLTTY
jgi:hypothetical protein